MGAITEQEQDSVAIFPDGKNSDDYKDCHSWSFHQWAWEFLRRNPEFQEYCNKSELDPAQFSKKEIKHKFGLVRFKHYREPYSAAPKERPKFKTSDVVCWPRVSEKIYQRIKQNLPKELKPGEVLVRFDIDKLSEASGSIDAMLEAAKRYLRRASEIWQRECGVSICKRRNRPELIPLLRLIDIDINRATSKLKNAQIVEIVYGQKAENIGDLSNHFRKKFKIAKMFRDSRYLLLAGAKKTVRKGGKKKRT
jgi:hypothetical protein